jgi:hypothetical protein
MAALDFALNAPDATVVWAVRADEYTAGDWPDRIGSADAVQATEGQQPTAVADGGSDFNNKPVVRWGGSDDILAFTLAQSQGLTIIAIAKVTLDNSAIRVLITDDSANQPALRWNGSNQLQMTAGANVTASADTLDVPLLAEAYYSGSSSILRANSISVASGNAGTATLSATILLGGQSAAGALPFGGDVAEIIIVDGELTAADRRYLAQYAQQRYGLAIPFPQTAAPTPSSFSSASVNHNVNMPPVVKAGDLLFALVSLRGSSDSGGVTTPSGWTLLASAGAASFRGWYVKVADGTEGGTTVNFVSGNTCGGAAQVYRVTEWHGGIVSGVSIGEEQATSTSTPNPPEVSTSWGSAKNLFFAAVLANDGDETLVSAPTNYADEVRTVGGAGTGFSAAVYSARRELEASSDDPGAFTLGFADFCGSRTLVIRPIATIPLAAGSGIIAAGL